MDNSGLRLFYTPDLRRYDAGVIEAGLWVSLFHNIPPGMPEFLSEGHCTLECLKEVCLLSSVINCDSLNKLKIAFFSGFHPRKMTNTGIVISMQTVASIYIPVQKMGYGHMGHICPTVRYNSHCTYF